MPLPLIPIAIAALFTGAGAAYAIQENDKAKLRKAALELEQMNAEMDRKLREARDQEIKNRIDKMGLLLRYYRTRLDQLLAEKETSFVRLARLAATATQLAVVSKRLQSDGNPHLKDRQFVEFVSIAMGGERPLSRSELAALDEYLEAEQPGAMLRFLKERYSSLFTSKTEELQDLGGEESGLKLELATMRARIEIDGPDRMLEANQRLLKARLDEMPMRKARTREELDDVRALLVIITRLSGAEHERTPHDDQVEDILRRKLDGSALLPEEREYLKVYQAAFFQDAREVLMREGLDLSGLRTRERVSA
jgi:hypothetical protein